MTYLCGYDPYDRRDHWHHGYDDAGRFAVKCGECGVLLTDDMPHRCPASGNTTQPTRRPAVSPSLLETVTTGTIAAPRRCMIYGPHGIGKSTWAAGAPGAIFINLEDGLNDIDCARFPLAPSFAEFRAQIAALYTGEHAYTTLVIDTADWLENLVLREVCTEGGKESIEDFGYGKGYVKAAEFFRNKVLAALDKLRLTRGMHIVLTAHAKIEKFEDPGLDSYDRYSPKLNKHISAVVQEWADEVLFCNYEVLIRKTDEGFGQKRALAVGADGDGAGKRVIYTIERPHAIAKSRLPLPGKMPLQWAAYSQHFNTAAPAGGDPPSS